MVNHYDEDFYKVIEEAVDFAWNPSIGSLDYSESPSTDSLTFKSKTQDTLCFGNQGVDTLYFGATDDKVNSPSHYTKGKVEAIDVIEDAIRHAPDPVVGMLQAQVLKYVLRCWHKGNAEQDLQKSEWYLRRLIKAVSNV